MKVCPLLLHFEMCNNLTDFKHFRLEACLEKIAHNLLQWVDNSLDCS
jgi:hypothetical protein